MKKATDIALRAHDLALEAAEAKRLAQEREAAEEERRKDQSAQAAYEAALPTLNEWFPGVVWTWQRMGDYGFDCIVTDASEVWPYSFLLKVDYRPKTKDSVEISVGEYRSDSSAMGYSYFSGGKIRSAADLGEYLKRKKS